MAAGVAAALLLAAVTLAALTAGPGGFVIERAASGEAVGAGEPGSEGQVTGEKDPDPAADEAQGAGTDEPAADEVQGAGADEPAADEAQGEGADEPTVLLVHVDGAVEAPGVYELEEGSRVNDAVLAAGGLLDEADTTSLNLAAPLADGQKVHVPVPGEASVAAGEGQPAAGQGGSGSDLERAPVNINTADVATLDELPGVGEATALAIVEDREANGPFTSPEDLMRVSGIGEKKFAKLEAMICV